MESQDARKDETMNPVAVPEWSESENAEVQRRVQRNLELYGRSTITRWITTIAENGLGIIDPAERRENELELFSLHVTLEVMNRQRKRQRQSQKEKTRGSNNPRLSHRAS